VYVRAKREAGRRAGHRGYVVSRPPTAGPPTADWAGAQLSGLDSTPLPHGPAPLIARAPSSARLGSLRLTRCVGRDSGDLTSDQRCHAVHPNQGALFFSSPLSHPATLQALRHRRPRRRAQPDMFHQRHQARGRDALEPLGLPERRRARLSQPRADFHAQARQERVVDVVGD